MPVNDVPDMRDYIQAFAAGRKIKLEKGRREDEKTLLSARLRSMKAQDEYQKSQLDYTARRNKDNREFQVFEALRSLRQPAEFNLHGTPLQIPSALDDRLTMEEKVYLQQVELDRKNFESPYQQRRRDETAAAAEKKLEDDRAYAALIREDKQRHEIQQAGVGGSLSSARWERENEQAKAAKNDAILANFSGVQSEAFSLRNSLIVPGTGRPEKHEPGHFLQALQGDPETFDVLVNHAGLDYIDSGTGSTPSEWTLEQLEKGFEFLLGQLTPVDPATRERMKVGSDEMAEMTNLLTGVWLQNNNYAAPFLTGEDGTGGEETGEDGTGKAQARFDAFNIPPEKQSGLKGLAQSFLGGPLTEQVEKMKRADAPWEEKKFKEWYGQWASKTGINPDPDDPLHKYDYRAAFRAGVTPTLNPDDGLYHWPSKFKDDDHPNLIVDGINTKTGLSAPAFGEKHASYLRKLDTDLDEAVDKWKKLGERRFDRTYNNSAGLLEKVRKLRRELANLMVDGVPDEQALLEYDEAIVKFNSSMAN